MLNLSYFNALANIQDSTLHLHMETIDRLSLAALISERLSQDAEQLHHHWCQPDLIPTFVLDDVLPIELAQKIHAAFPEKGRMSFKSSMRERKYVSAQMDELDPIIEEVVFAFQQPSVVAEIEKITGIVGLEPDADLYAGGISAMARGNYLKPHLDNSHDRNQDKYRAVNLLYYVTPNWGVECGGHFELWDAGPKASPRTILSSFNRLVVMATNRTSWHSVSMVTDERSRCCVSNYYFCDSPPESEKYFHATSFRGRPDEPMRDVVMRMDNALRTTILKTTGTRIYKNPHVYRRDK